PISTISYSTLLFIQCSPHLLPLHSFPTRRSSDLTGIPSVAILNRSAQIAASYDRGAIQDIPNVSRVRSANAVVRAGRQQFGTSRSEEHTSELQSRENLVCRLLLEKKKKKIKNIKT